MVWHLWIGSTPVHGCTPNVWERSVHDAEHHRHGLDRLRIDEALVRVHVLNPPLDERVESAEVDRDTSASVDPELRTRAGAVAGRRLKLIADAEGAHAGAHVR